MTLELLIFIVAVLGAYLMVCLFDPWVDCGWCEGSPKKRGSGASMTVTLGVGATLFGALMGIPVGPVLLGLLCFWAATSIFSTGRSYHFCSIPGWLGGCGGNGRRRRLGSLILGMGLGKLD